MFASRTVVWGVGTPLFLHTPFQSVHAPIQAPPESVAPYAHLTPQRRVFAGMLSMLDAAIGKVAGCFAAKVQWRDLVQGKPHTIVSFGCA